jgi:hypothetical protein
MNQYYFLIKIHNFSSDIFVHHWVSIVGGHLYLSLGYEWTHYIYHWAMNELTIFIIGLWMNSLLPLFDKKEKYYNVCLSLYWSWDLISERRQNSSLHYLIQWANSGILLHCGYWTIFDLWYSQFLPFEDTNCWNFILNTLIYIEN